MVMAGEMAALWRAFADAAGPLVVSALWQGLALALALALCLRLTPRIAAADRFRAWAAGFAALVALPFLPSLFAHFPSFFHAASPAPAAFLPASPVTAPHAWLDLDPRWSLAIAGFWIAASLARAVDLGVHTVRLRRLWKRAVPLSGANAPQLRDGIFDTEVVPCYKADLPAVLGRSIEICTTRDLDRPSVIGFFAPRILIPEWLLKRLTPAELEQVVLHEAEHLRRHDDWINLLQKLCLVAFPLNPALAWMERRLCREREIACDESVVRRTQAPRAYAACLASLAERRLERRHGLKHPAEVLSLGAWQRRPELVDRVHRILRRAPGLHPAAARALLGVVSCGLVLGSVELARCPQVVEFAARPAAFAMSPVAAVDGQPMRGFRAIDAMAHVPSRAELAEARLALRTAARKSRPRWSPTRAAHFQKADPPLRPAPDDSADGARSVPAKANDFRQADSGSEIAVKDAATAAHPQQWIVYTEWEQVETTSANPMADQDTPRVSRQLSVTQLILQVYPAGAMKTGESNTDAAIPTGARSTAAKIKTNSSLISIAPLPAAIPIRDGWLVIQL